MFVVFEHSFEGTSLVVITEDPLFAEDTVVSKFKDVADEGEELIMRVVDGVTMYATRIKIQQEPIDDGFEYVDNEGNPIHADGTDILDSDQSAEDEVSQEPKYDIVGDFFWTTREIELDQVMNPMNDVYHEMSLATISPFEDENEIAIVTST